MEKIIQIVELIKRGESDLESELNLMDVTLSQDFISEVFRLLNCDGVSGLRFFSWVSETQIDFKRNSEFCSLIIDNLGKIEDYDSMLFVLKDFSSKGICITEKAFAFLPVSCSDVFEVRNNVKKVIETLNKAGGSSRNSGIFALIKMLCTSNYFDLAIYVMEETARKTSYYNVLIWAKCCGSKFQEARELFDEMRRFGCNPNTNSFNYLLGSLCKNGRIGEACNLLEVMTGWGYLPDAITFEIFIYRAFRHGRLDFAVEFLDQMMYRGLEPRLTTHTAFIKGYFYSNRFQEAYKYVIDMSVKYKCSGNMNYSLLASLHQRKGMLLEAREILVDMIEKGLKPNFPVYIKVMKDLHKSGMGHLVADLKTRFSKFNSNANAE
ncbi:Pentatricopeptide repeat [Macleaya cordata]|uniref:Pentatricopeptide repeat n=1 Tax=Macleaya cordata TaxID=56857 RepID=A0A200PQK5_MACCD|nr:Pentatricopeptide repeat [Macleaya cordata]